MSYNRKIFIFIIAVFMLIFTGCEIRYNYTSTHLLKEEDAKDFTVEKSIVEPIEEIDINVRIADVEILPADDYYVEIDYTYWKDEPKYSIKNGIFTFDDTNSFPQSYSVNFKLSNTIRIYLPEDILLKKLHANNSNGNISISSITSNNLNCVLSYGNLDLTMVTAAKANITLSCGNSMMEDTNIGILKYVNSYGMAEFININTEDIKLPNETSYESIKVTMSCGNCTIKGLKSPIVTLINSYGDITCDKISADEFNTNLSCGDLRLDESEVKVIDARSSYGNVSLSLIGKKDDYSLDIRTSFGDAILNGEKYDDELVVKNNSSNNITVNSSNGDINIDFK